VFAVEVTLNGQDWSVSGVEFSYDVPLEVSDIWPVMGPAATGGTVLTVRGRGFVQSTDLSCRFGHTLVPATYLSDDTLLCAAPPSAPGLVSFEVTNSRLAFSTSGTQFMYVPDASVYALNPTQGPASGQYAVFVLGSNFVNSTALRCRFDSQIVRATFLSPRLLACLAPSRSAGLAEFAKSSVVVEVSNNGLDYSDSRVTFDFYDRCRPGFYCPGLVPLPCPNGTACPGSVGLNFTLCSPGTFQPRSQQVSCLPCPVGYYCPDFGLSKPVLCPAGYVCDTTGLQTPVTPCPPGHFCLPGKHKHTVALGLRDGESHSRFICRRSCLPV
jgi:hypothetical protein